MARTPKYIRRYGKKSLGILRSIGRPRKAGISCHGRAIWYARTYIPPEILAHTMMHESVVGFEKSESIKHLTNRKNFEGWIRSRSLINQS